MLHKIVALFLVFFCVFCYGQYYEGETCFKNGVRGVCVTLKQCQSAIEDIKQRKKPQICSYDRRYPIVCCTDGQAESACEPLDEEFTSPKNGRKAHDKCIEYQEKYVYPCEAGVDLLAGEGRSNNCHHKTDDLIIAGVDAAQYEFPHMALLGYGDLKNVEWQCGGSIISEKYILTAGHCIENVKFLPVSYVAIGVLKRSEIGDPSKIYKVKRVIKHPDFKPPAKYNDIALVETEREMALDQFTVPACLHTGDAVNETRVLATGWGLTHSGGKVLSNTLQKVILDKFLTRECSQKYMSFRRVMKKGFDGQTQSCYGDKGKPQEYQDRLESKDTCQGDSGGPIQIKNQDIHCMYTITGVTSIGKGCGFRPALYTKVAEYVPWIEGIVWP